MPRRRTERALQGGGLGGLRPLGIDPQGGLDAEGAGDSWDVEADLASVRGLALDQRTHVVIDETTRLDSDTDAALRGVKYGGGSSGTELKL